MKKWTIILIVMLTVLNFGSFVLADEIDENTEVLANDGRVIMNFIDENYSPVVGASVHINLSTDNGMIDIRELGLNTVIVLESDQNGIVVINDLPYGFYEYYVDYVPLGYECLYTASNFFVSPAEDVAYVNVMFKEDVAMVAAPIEEVVKEEMEEEEEKEEVVVPVQEEIITPIPRTEASVITTQVNTFTTKIYNVDDTTGTIEKKEEMNNTPVLIAQVEEDEQEIAVINKTIRILFIIFTSILAWLLFYKRVTRQPYALPTCTDIVCFQTRKSVCTSLIAAVQPFETERSGVEKG